MPKTPVIDYRMEVAAPVTDRSGTKPVRDQVNLTGSHGDHGEEKFVFSPPCLRVSV